MFRSGEWCVGQAYHFPLGDRYYFFLRKTENAKRLPPKLINPKVGIIPPETGISGTAAVEVIVEVGITVGVLVGVGVKVDVGVAGAPSWDDVGLGVAVAVGDGIFVGVEEEIIIAVGLAVSCAVGVIFVDTSWSVLGAVFVMVNVVEQVGVKALVSAGVGLLVSLSSRAVDKASTPKPIQEATRNIITKLFFIRRINFIYF